ncbi:MAG: Smr/MutS family protein [Maricaulaceae bacterium]
MSGPRKPKSSSLKGRNLAPEEVQIWKRVTKTVAPRRKGSAKPVPSREEFAAMLRLPPQGAVAARKTPKSLDVNQDKKIRRGRVEIDAKIDLHDLTQAQARPALVQAIIRASNRNHRCVLVVTGKGIRMEGVLRRNFPEWISQVPIRPLIATYAPAHIRHGGSGAWYVFLKGRAPTA